MHLNINFAMKNQPKIIIKKETYEPEKTSKEGWADTLSAAVEEEEHWQLWVLSLNGAMSESFLENGVERWWERNKGKGIWFRVFIKAWGGMESGGPKQVSAIITVVEEANTLHLKIKIPFFLFFFFLFSNSIFPFSTFVNASLFLSYIMRI